MRILFGAEHDGLHINPAEPNGYEWWYFDAVSDDEQYILVVIFFCGTPMSPYYKAVVDGKNPLPKDWCGVFVSLHERTASGYQERAYAYNLYTGGDFATDGSSVTVGGSGMTRDDAGAWHVSLRERGLWFGETVADLSFTPTIPNLRHDVIPGDESHTWVCVAPDCRVSGDIVLGKQTMRFAGRGYHDHNFGRLPWISASGWYWDRLHLTQGRNGGAVSYQWDGTMFVGAWNTEKGFCTECNLLDSETASSDGTEIVPSDGYSFRATMLGISEAFMIQKKPLQAAPFYRRFPLRVETKHSGETVALGIGETFEPARLTGAIMSRALWTRIRRRS